MGEGILWKKSLNVGVSRKISASDRICTVDISLSCQSPDTLTLVNIYCPSADHNEAEYAQCLQDLEELVCMHDLESCAIIIAGDFNAHLGTLAGPRGTGTPNSRGLQLIDRNSLFVASHSQQSFGPNYTYHSGSHFTTIDYIVVNRLAAEFLTDSRCMSEHSLNVSDHLALSLSLSLDSTPITHQEEQLKIDWRKSIESGKILTYEASVKDIVLPVLNTTNNSVSQLDDEIRHICSSIRLTADNLLPKLTRGKKRRNHFKDDHLKELCYTSKAAWRVWKQSGRPRDGQLWENMKLAKKDVRRKIHALRARRDRLQSERRDETFREKHKSRYKMPRSGIAHGQRLNVNDHVLTDKEAVLNEWAHHFKDLSSSRASESSALSSLDSLISTYRCATFENDDFILDCDITTEEISGVIKLLKKGKACGPDNILPEHIIYGGDYLVIWLKKVFNEIIQLERIPSSLKDTIIVPIYKGKGKDPLLARGISLSSVLVKLFERVLLLRMIPILEEKGIPHRTQTAYQAGVSCSDATEVVQEVIKSYIDSGANIFQCFYDLEKAFDSIEHNVLLNHLYKAGINGKCWRVIAAFYEEVVASVRLGTRLSDSFHLNRGVKQG